MDVVKSAVKRDAVVLAAAVAVMVLFVFVVGVYVGIRSMEPPVTPEDFKACGAEHVARCKEVGP